MKSTLRHWLWTFLVLSRLDGFVASRAVAGSTWHKFIPLSRYYKGKPPRRFIRNGVSLDLPLEEYTNWKLFANEPFLGIALASVPRHAGKRILDIGANSGFFSLSVAAAWLEARDSMPPAIFAFEPSPSTYGRLQRHLELNPRIQPLISPQQQGLGEKPGVMEIAVPIRNSGLGSLVRYEKNRDEPVNMQQVNIDTLDGFLANQPDQVPVSFCKIDVECFEPYVIRGGMQTLEQDHPCIQIEFGLSCGQFHPFGDMYLIDTLEALGYELFVIGETKIRAFSREHISAYGEQFDLLATIHPNDYQVFMA